MYNKAQFSWVDSEITLQQMISEGVRHPDVCWQRDPINGYLFTTIFLASQGQVKVLVEQKSGRIITAYPTKDLFVYANNSSDSQVLSQKRFESKLLNKYQDIMILLNKYVSLVASLEEQKMIVTARDLQEVIMALNLLLLALIRAEIPVTREEFSIIDDFMRAQRGDFFIKLEHLHVLDAGVSSDMHLNRARAIINKYAYLFPSQADKARAYDYLEAGEIFLSLALVSYMLITYQVAIAESELAFLLTEYRNHYGGELQENFFVMVGETYLFYPVDLMAREDAFFFCEDYYRAYQFFGKYHGYFSNYIEKIISFDYLYHGEWGLALSNCLRRLIEKEIAITQVEYRWLQTMRDSLPADAVNDDLLFRMSDLLVEAPSAINNNGAKHESKTRN